MGSQFAKETQQDKTSEKKCDFYVKLWKGYFRKDVIDNKSKFIKIYAR